LFEDEFADDTNVKFIKESANKQDEIILNNLFCVPKLIQEVGKNLLDFTFFLSFNKIAIVRILRTIL